MIKTLIKIEKATEHLTECMVLLTPESEKPSGVLKELDKVLKGLIHDAFSQKRFEGKANQTLLLNVKGHIGSAFVLLAGLGKARDLTEDVLRKTAGTASRLAEKSKFKKVSFLIPRPKLKAYKSSKVAYDQIAAALMEGIYLSLYHFDHYKNFDLDNPPIRIGEINLLAESQAVRVPITRAIHRAGIIAQAVCGARDLINHPSNIATPSYLADFARKIARKHGITFKVLTSKDMEKLGMGALLGVAKGADEPPKFIILEYQRGRKGVSPIVVIGKGVTFDTGGISLKPPANMDEMKMDMSGAAATIGTLQAVAALKLRSNVIGLIPVTENMPGGSAIKPGDIITSLSGKTVEVLNTDAEGRLILCDALTYAQRYKPKVVIDLATLTGAVIIALGHHFCGALGNSAELMEKLKKSGIATGECLWELPLTEEYEKAMKSSIADLKNIAGPGFGAGTITGGAFLKFFAGEQPWVHLDIAGTAWSSEEKHYLPKGGAGFGVRLLTHYIENQT